MHDLDAIQKAVADFESSAVTDESRYERGAYETIAEVAVPSAREAMLLGAGNLALGKCNRAKEWFGDSAPAWVWKFETSVEMALGKDTSITGLKWLNAQKAIKTAILSESKSVLRETLVNLEEPLNSVPETTSPRNRGHKLFCDALVAFGASGLDANINSARPLQAVVSRLNAFAADSEDLAKQFHGSFATAFAGVESGDLARVETGIERLGTYHETSIEEDQYCRSTDEVEETLEACVSIDACTVVVLARLHGLDPDADTEYVPELVTDRDCYPIRD